MTTSQHRGRKRSAPIATSRAVAVFATAVATTLVVAGAGAFADPGNTSHVDAVTAAVDAGGIAVTGRATFVDVPVVVGEDADDDAIGSAAPLGHELTTATISRPDPFADMLTFAIGVANQPPETDGVPEGVLYRWDFSVTMGGGKPRDVTLRAWRTTQGNQASRQDPADPYFDLLFLASRSAGSIAQVPVTGSMGNGIVAWNVPMGTDETQGQIGQAGRIIPADSHTIHVANSAEEKSPTAEEAVVLDDIAADTAYTVPGPGVRIGIAPAGTAPADLPLTVSAAVSSSGAFTGRLPRPATPGEYTIAARACHAPHSCGIATTNITVP